MVKWWSAIGGVVEVKGGGVGVGGEKRIVWGKERKEKEGEEGIKKIVRREEKEAQKK